MGTTRIKVIDLSSDKQEIKTSRKHAEKLAGFAKIKTDQKTQPPQKISTSDEPESPLTSKPDIQEPSESGTKKKSAISIDTQIDQKTDTTEPVSTQITQGAAGTTRRKSLHHQGKKYDSAKKLVENKTYSVKDALELLPKTSITHFDPSVEVHLNVADKNIKGSVSFPHTLKDQKKNTQRYLIFVNQKPKTSDQQTIIWGDEKTIEQIEKGSLKPKRDFDLVIASPKFMPSLAKVAKILGPAHLMPNPKNGTVTDDFQKIIGGKNESSYNFKTDPNAPIIHAKIGKLSQGDEKLAENLKTLIFAIGPAKIKKSVVTTTMGPGIKFDAQTI